MFTAQGPQVLCFVDSTRYVLHAIVVQFAQVRLVINNYRARNAQGSKFYKWLSDYNFTKIIA